MLLCRDARSRTGLTPGAVARCVEIHRGAGGPETAAFRTDDFFYYYCAVREAFLDQQRAFNPDQEREIPPLADLGRWSGYAEHELTERDDLALVADIRTCQIHKLRTAGIATMAQLAAASGIRVPRLNDATFARLRLQASLQIASPPSLLKV
jgi:hypothetical protein